MTTKFGVFGCCTSRDLFFSKINPNYKSYFQLINAAVRNSVISIMSSPMEYNEESIKIFPENKDNVYRTRLIKEDFEKVFLKNIKNNPPEYLIFDTYFDAKWGVIDLGDKYITNNLWDLPNTKFYKDLSEVKTLTFKNDSNKFFRLWKESFDSFFNFLDINCPDLKLIINPIKNVCHVRGKDGSIEINEILKNSFTNENEYMEKFNRYICQNYDIEILNFDDNTLASNSHQWGLNSVHFESNYYLNTTNQLNDLIERNDKLGFNSNINKEFRELKRNNYLYKSKPIRYGQSPFDKIVILENQNKQLNNQVNELLKFKIDVLNSNSWKLTGYLRKIKNR